jgi:hypothetical protein
MRYPFFRPNTLRTRRLRGRTDGSDQVEERPERTRLLERGLGVEQSIVKSLRCQSPMETPADATFLLMESMHYKLASAISSTFAGTMAGT